MRDLTQQEKMIQQVLQRLFESKSVYLANDWESRVQHLENQGLTRSDAQAVVDAEDRRVE